MAQITMTEALNKAIDEAMAEDDGVFCLGEIGAAVGAALAGQRPIAEIMLMNFVGVCMDQIVNHAAKLRFMSGGQTPCPIVIRTTTGVGVGFGGQHSDMLEAWFAHVAGMHVVTPSNAADARGLMRSAIDANDPVIFIENILCYGLQSEDPGPGYRVPLGKAAIAKEGSDISLITYGRTVLASVNKTGRALTLHEAVRPFGVGAELAANVQEKCWDNLKGPVRRIGGTFSAVPFATHLEQAWIPTKGEIVEQIKASVGKD